jgi:hypothetical protein
MKKKLCLLCGLSVLISQFSCQRKTFDPSLAGSFFPLKPGLAWTYRIIGRNYGSSGMLTDRVAGTRRLRTLEIGTEIVSHYLSPAGMAETTIVYVPEHGYLTRQLVVSNRDLITSEHAFLPQLLRPDLTWSSSLLPFGPEQGTFHVAETHRSYLDPRTIEVPAGNFTDCIRIETVARYESTLKVNPSLQLKYIDWYAARVGLVKTLVLHTGLLGSEIARIELIAFASAPGAQASPRRGVSEHWTQFPFDLNSTLALGWWSGEQRLRSH